MSSLSASSEDAMFLNCFFVHKGFSLASQQFVKSDSDFLLRRSNCSAISFVKDARSRTTDTSPSIWTQSFIHPMLFSDALRISMREAANLRRFLTESSSLDPAANQLLGGSPRIKKVRFDLWRFGYYFW